MVLTAGRVIVLDSSFSIETGGALRCELDGSIYPFSYVKDTTPDSEEVYNARFFINLDALTIGTLDEIQHFVAHNGGEEPQLRLLIRMDRH